ncbi:hypothetical protein L2X99_12035 [Microbacterium sp. KUDC0406]|uniref:hypothetical protein n=1 Tax=Microbacterium sp. KUDC0406 TaxID=2909588 RepID=UPI001F26CE54|nr:hypothetical protein [Microbacterium sp. KUDC0406]UJP09172.1 hypothetical protein L2X99_12035 [Microbacterium sp. KUDC0406]
MLLIPLDEGTIALRRQIGRHDGMLLYVDVFVESGAQLYEAEQDITALFASIEVQPA